MCDWSAAAAVVAVALTHAAQLSPSVLMSSPGSASIVDPFHIVQFIIQNYINS